MNDVVFKTLKGKDFVIKSFIFKIATELKLSLNETILLIYLINQETPVLNLESIKKAVYLNEEEIMDAYGNLLSINLISVDIKKSEDGKREEIISLDKIYELVTTDITANHNKNEKNNLFEIFEREFGRPLSTMEFEIINEWLSSGYSKELIVEALKESIYNGYHSLKNISKILSFWKEKGCNTKEEVSTYLKNETELEKTMELFDYNWLEDE